MDPFALFRIWGSRISSFFLPGHFPCNMLACAYRPCCLLAISLITMSLAGVPCPSQAQGKAGPEARWEKEISAFEASDQTNPPPKNAIEFAGSSSIRLWKKAPDFFPGHKVFTRGFGGSEMSDLVAFAGRIVIPYQPKLVLVYEGDNDIAAGKSPERVFRDFKALVEKGPRRVARDAHRVHCH